MEFQKQEILSGATLLFEGLLGSLTVYSFSVQSPSCKDIHVGEIRPLYSLEAKRVWNVQVEHPHRRRTSTRPTCCDQEIPFLRRYHPSPDSPTFRCLPESQRPLLLVSCLESLRIPFFWVAVNADILLSYRPQGNPRVIPENHRAPVLGSPKHCKWAGQWWAGAGMSEWRGWGNHWEVASCPPRKQTSVVWTTEILSLYAI